MSEIIYMFLTESYYTVLWVLYLRQHLPETQGADNSRSGGLVSRMRESSLVADNCGPGNDTSADAQTHRIRPEVD